MYAPRYLKRMAHQLTDGQVGPGPQRETPHRSAFLSAVSRRIGPMIKTVLLGLWPNMLGKFGSPAVLRACLRLLICFTWMGGALHAYGQEFSSLRSDAHAGPIEQHLNDWREELEFQLEKYTDCQGACASEMAKALTHEFIEAGLAIIGLSTDSTIIRSFAGYTLARRVWIRGEEIISESGLCARSCDELEEAIVELGRAGLLGPLISEGPIDPETFSEPAMLELWLEHVPPIDPRELPATFHNDIRWDEIQRTG